VRSAIAEPGMRGNNRAVARAAGVDWNVGPEERKRAMPGATTTKDRPATRARTGTATKPTARARSGTRAAAGPAPGADPRHYRAALNAAVGVCRRTMAAEGIEGEALNAAVARFRDKLGAPLRKALEG
jgi:hypothetical protein